MATSIPKFDNMVDLGASLESLKGGPIVNGTSSEIIDDDIHHTVGRLLHTRPQNNNHVKSKKEPLEITMSKALQAERNHWKERIQMSMHEIDRQHRIILATESGLQELVKSLRNTLQRNVILEEEEEEMEEMDQEVVMSRLLEQLRFQMRQMKQVRLSSNSTLEVSGTDTSKVEFDNSQTRQKESIKELGEAVKKLEREKQKLEDELTQGEERIQWMKKENASLNRQLKKYQAITERYNEKHSGSNFHLKIVESGRDKHPSVSTLDLHENSISTVRERVYVEGDAMGSYPDPTEENAIIKDRLKKNIYSARKGDQRSSNVAQCFRCQALFRPAENNHKACKFHHKGREIKEQFDANGKLDKVLYKWACCKKSLEAPGCCFGYHV